MPVPKVPLHVFRVRPLKGVRSLWCRHSHPPAATRVAPAWQRRGNPAATQSDSLLDLESAFPQIHVDAGATPRQQQVEREALQKVSRGVHSRYYLAT